MMDEDEWGIVEEGTASEGCLGEGSVFSVS